MSVPEKLDVLDMLINVLNEHEKRMDTLVDRVESITRSMEGHPELSSAFREYEEQEKAQRPSQLSVLIVDDDEFLADTFEMLLKDAGFAVETANSGNEALTKMSRFKFDLAILDYKLPDIPGSKLSKMLKEKDGDLNVVMLTGHMEALENHTTLDSDEILMKPISPDELLKITRKLSSRV
ncbi:response regulator [Candidatus Bathyarchaeota archaeon]|nr:response regulator [Candidatus Bathyarchaeota archaeon]